MWWKIARIEMWLQTHRWVWCKVCQKFKDSHFIIYTNIHRTRTYLHVRFFFCLFKSFKSIQIENIVVVMKNDWLTDLCANYFPIHDVGHLDDVIQLHFDDEQRRLQQLPLLTINPYDRCIHFHFLIVIRALHVSYFPHVIPRRLDCGAAHVVIVIGYVDPVFGLVVTVTNHSLSDWDDEGEIQEKSFVGNAMVVDSNVECPSMLFK